MQRDCGFRSPNAGKSDEELLTEAIEKKDVGLTKLVKDLRKAKGDPPIKLITILGHQGWIGPFDEYALETLWGSFDDKVLDVWCERRVARI